MSSNQANKGAAPAAAAAPTAAPSAPAAGAPVLNVDSWAAGDPDLVPTAVAPAPVPTAPAAHGRGGRAARAAAAAAAAAQALQPAANAVFEDEANGSIELPQGLGHRSYGWKRVMEGGQPAPVFRLADPAYTRESNVSARSGASVRAGPDRCGSWYASTFAALLESGRARAAPEGEYMWELLFPHDAAAPVGTSAPPVQSPTGRYAARLCLMRTWRKVVVDDRMPVDQSGAHLLPRMAAYPEELWPALMTKAMLKLCSRAALPESLKPTWRSLQSALREAGAIVTAVATATAERLAATGLAADHLYSVQETREFKGVRLVKLLSPFSKWTGKYGAEDTEFWTPSNLATFDYTIPEAAPYAFWMSIDDFLSTFAASNWISTTQYEHTKVHEVDCTSKNPTTHLLYFDQPVESQLVVVGLVTGPVTSKAASRDGSCWQIELFEHMSATAQPTIAMSLKGATMVAGRMTVPAGRHIYAIRPDCSAPSQLHFHSTGEFSVEDAPKVMGDRLRLHQATVEGIFKAQEPWTWNVLFRYQITVKEELTAVVRLIMTDDATRPVVRLRIVDNEKLVDLPVFNHCSVPLRLAANRAGYAVVGECRSSAKTASGMYQLTVTSTSSGLSIDADPWKSAHEVEETLPTLPHEPRAVVMRHVLKSSIGPTSASMNVSMLAWPAPLPRLRLQLFDRDVMLAERVGVGCVTLPCVRLLKQLDAQQAPPSAAGAPGPGSAQATSTNNAQSTMSSTNSLSNAPKYVVQVVLEEQIVDQSYVTGACSLSSAPPPQSASTTASSAMPLGAVGRAISRQKTANRSTAGLGADKSRTAAGMVRSTSAMNLAASGGGNNTTTAPPVRTRALFQDPPDSQLHVRLKVLSGTPLEGRRDTEREEAHLAAKLQWERDGGSGRAVRAAASRERYLQARALELQPAPAVALASSVLSTSQLILQSVPSAPPAQMSTTGGDPVQTKTPDDRERERNADTRFRDAVEASMERKHTEWLVWLANQKDLREKHVTKRAEIAAAAAASAVAAQQGYPDAGGASTGPKGAMVDVDLAADAGDKGGSLDDQNKRRGRQRRAGMAAVAASHPSLKVGEKTAALKTSNSFRQ
eukprot:m51a1_g7476 putative calpain protease-like protein (1096) ;mRNA; f:200203-204254